MKIAGRKAHACSLTPGVWTRGHGGLGDPPGSTRVVGVVYMKTALTSAPCFTSSFAVFRSPSYTACTSAGHGSPPSGKPTPTQARRTASQYVTGRKPCGRTHAVGIGLG